MLILQNFFAKLCTKDATSRPDIPPFVLCFQLTKLCEHIKFELIFLAMEISVSVGIAILHWLIATGGLSMESHPYKSVVAHAVVRQVRLIGHLVPCVCRLHAYQSLSVLQLLFPLDCSALFVC